MERRAEDTLESIRRTMLLVVLPLLGLGFVLGAVALDFQPLPHHLAFSSHLLAAVLTAGLLLLLIVDLIGTRSAATGVMVALVAVVLIREWTFFSVAAAGAAVESLMLPIYGFLPLAFLLTSATLRPRASLALNSLSCLLVAAVPLYFLLFAPISDPLPASAFPLLMLVCLGFPTCVVLFWLHATATMKVAGLYRSSAIDARHAQLEANKRQQNLEALFQYASTGIGTIDADGRWVQVNERLCEITGYSDLELLRHDIGAIFHPAEQDDHTTLATQLRAGEIDSFQVERRLLRKDRSIVWVKLSLGRIVGESGGDANRYVVVVTDINEQREAKNALERFNADLEHRIHMRTRSLQKVNSALSGLAEFVGVLQSAQTQEDLGNIVLRVLPDLLEAKSGSLLVTSPSDSENIVTLVSWGGTDDYHGKVQDCWALRRGRRHSNWKTGGTLNCEHVVQSGGHFFHVCQPLISNTELVGVLTLIEASDPHSKPGRFESRILPILATVSDYIAAALMNLRLNERLRESATRDFLTGLYNRRTLQEQCGQVLSTSDRTGIPVSLAMIDIDYFKNFNDDYGHSLGDQVLREVALVLQKNSRQSDLVFRLGGEEFLIVMPGTDLEGAVIVAEKMRRAVNQVTLIHKGDRIPKPTISVGLSGSPTHGSDFDHLLVVADKALYEAKDAGRDRCHVMNDEPDFEPMGFESPARSQQIF